jgi:hypothetical protein
MPLHNVPEHFSLFTANSGGTQHSPTDLSVVQPSETRAMPYAMAEHIAFTLPPTLMLFCDVLYGCYW